MSKKMNGSGNGHDKDDQDKVVSFPTLADRDRQRRAKIEAEKRQKRTTQIRGIKSVKTNASANDVPFMNLHKITPFVRFFMAAIIAVQLYVFLMLDFPARYEAFQLLGFVPANFTNGLNNMPWYAPLGLASHVFIHGSWMHLVFNGVMAMALGILFERNFGTRTTTIFFFACAGLGALLYFVISPASTAPVIGASGGISGLFAATIIMLNENGQMGKIGRRGPWPVLGFWMVFMLITGFLSGEDTAWHAHLGGFLGGIGLYFGLKRGLLKF